MQDDKCSKGFPKRFQEETKFGSGGRVAYRRRQSGLIVTCGRKVIDNSMVVPHNGYLLLRYRAHINVEYVQNVRSCKYSFKYINKGADSAVYTLEERNVIFEEGEEQEAVQKYEENNSMLEAYFQLNCDDAAARRLKYLEIPEHYRFISGKWVKRIRKSTKGSIPRMHTISPAYREKFHLRILLLHTTGALSFQDLRTVSGVECSSFERAAQMRHLTTTDEEWIAAMEEAALIQMPAQMRRFFVYILLYCQVGEPVAIWNRFRRDLSEDYLRRGRNTAQAETSALWKINRILRHHDKTLLDFGLPLDNADQLDNNDIEPSQVEELESSINLNAQQQMVFDRVMSIVENANVQERWLFINGSAGTGKTSLYNEILREMKHRNQLTMAVALTGIAALLLRDGKTAHSAVRIPLEINETTTSGIKINSPEGQTLRNVKLIVWDEVTMTHYMAIDVVDRLLRDIKQDNRPFGGTCVVLGGDLKQLLSVESDRVKQVEALFVNCASWKSFTTYNLTINMRTNADELEFARWLVALGRGDLNVRGPRISPNSVEIPSHVLTDNVMHEIYGGEGNLQSGCQERAILCPTNLDCDRINSKILDSLPGDIITSLSVDSVVEEDAIVDLQEEVLNASTPRGMPHHVLKVKIGAPVMLLRNVSVIDGLVNGTRLIVRDMNDHVLKAEILTGQFAGRIVLLPKMDMQSFDENLMCTLRRRPFPVKLCFAMTINKSQGQTFKKVGIYLSTSVFSHGQLYVAFSRVRKWGDVKIQIRDTRTQGRTILGQDRAVTKNVVYKSIFRLINNIQH